MSSVQKDKLVQRRGLATMPKQDLALNPHSHKRICITLPQDMVLLKEAINILEAEMRDTNSQTTVGARRYKALTVAKDVLVHLRRERSNKRDRIDRKIARREKTVMAKRREQAARMRERKKELRLSRLGKQVMTDLKGV